MVGVITGDLLLQEYLQEGEEGVKTFMACLGKGSVIKCWNSLDFLLSFSCSMSYWFALQWLLGCTQETFFSVCCRSGHLSPLAVNTMNQNVLSSIKSEPISPPRESTTPSNHHSLRPPSSAGPGHLSPVQNLNHTHSNSSSPTGISPHPLDYDGPHLKRQRVGGWPT